MARLLLLGASYRRNSSQQPLPALERYDGVYFRVVRKHLSKAEDVDIYVVTEDLELIPADQLIPYRPPAGRNWRYTPKAPKEKVEEFRKSILELVKSKRYDEAL